MGGACPETWCPFGDIRRSGCSPAEPYSADDTGPSSRPEGLAMIIPATIQNRSLPVISTPSFPSKSVTNVIGLTLTYVPVRTPSGCRCGKSGQVLRFNNSDSSPNTNLLGRCLAAVASPRYHPRRRAFIALLSIFLPSRAARASNHPTYARLPRPSSASSKARSIVQARFVEMKHLTQFMFDVVRRSILKQRTGMRQITFGNCMLAHDFC